MAAKSSASPTKEPTFEIAIARLELIAEEMESDKLPLEDLLTRYEEGIQLVKVCEERLKSAERRIEIITRNAAGEPRIEEFEPEKKPVAEKATAERSPSDKSAAENPRDEVSLF